MRALFALSLGLLFSLSVFSQEQLRASATATIGVSVDATRPRRVAKTPVTDVAQAERMVFNLLNQKRAELGLSPLVWSDQVAAIAREHSSDMATMKYFSHKDLNGKMVSGRADDAGIRRWRAIGENIAFNKGYKDPITGAVESWMNSESHRHNLLDDHWRESAIGVAIADDGSYFFTQVFLKR